MNGGRKGSENENIEKVLPKYVEPRCQFFFIIFFFFSKTASVHKLAIDVAINLAHFNCLQQFMYNLIGRHDRECKLKWVRRWNVSQPIRRLNLTMADSQSGHGISGP